MIIRNKNKKQELHILVVMNKNQYIMSQFFITEHIYMFYYIIHIAILDQNI